jgi:ABC-type Fe3+-hydroxamate transport system substrate-binding protein
LRATFRRIRFISRLDAVPILGILLAVGACSGQGDQRTSPGSLIAVDDAGDTVRLAVPASHVVSLMPATTEILFAIGDGPKVVGRTRWCDYPAEAQAVPSVGDVINPNLEAIVAVHPDLVVMYRSGSNAAAASRLRQMGIPTLQVTVDRLADVARVGRLLGQLTGREREADSVGRKLDADLASLVAPTDSTAPRVLIVAWDQPPIAIGAGSFLSELVARAGGINVFNDLSAPSAQVSLEAIVQRNPDVLLVSSDGPPSLASRPEWQVIPAVRAGRFVHVASSAFNRPSPRAPEAIRELREKLRAVPR